MQHPQTYKEQNYQVFPQLIPLDLIDELLHLYKTTIVDSSDRFFRQSLEASQV